MVELGIAGKLRCKLDSIDERIPLRGEGFSL